MPKHHIEILAQYFDTSKECPVESKENIDIYISHSGVVSICIENKFAIILDEIILKAIIKQAASYFDIPNPANISNDNNNIDSKISAA